MSSCPGPEEGGVPTGAVRTLQPQGPLPGSAAGCPVLCLRGQRAARAGLQSHVGAGGRHEPLQEDAGADVCAAGSRREPTETGKNQCRPGSVSESENSLTFRPGIVLVLVYSGPGLELVYTALRLL